MLFGEFTLRSGRISPYFFNIARFRTGTQLSRLGDHMAATVEIAAPHATIVFGPAYKGIPLCIATAMAMSRRTGREIGYLFDRKEVKTHGDAGAFVGSEPGKHDRLVMVDDVITDGKTKREAVAKVRATFDVPIDAVVIAFNRMEQDAQGRDAILEFERQCGIPVHALLTLAELQEVLDGGMAGALGDAEHERDLSQRIQAYRERYGVGG